MEVPLWARHHGDGRWERERDAKAMLSQALPSGDNTLQFKAGQASEGYAGRKKKVNLTSIIGSSLRKKARSREETALSIVLVMLRSVTQLLLWRNRPCSPEWSCHKTEWEGSGFQPKRIYMASCINNQAFPAVPNISGNFLIQRTGKQLHFPTCYSWFLCITRIKKKKKNSWAMSFHRTI